MSRTKQAIELMNREGISAYKAAKRLAITSSSVYAEISRQKNTKRCPHCNGKLTDSKQKFIDSSNL